MELWDMKCLCIISKQLYLLVNTIDAKRIQKYFTVKYIIYKMQYSCYSNDRVLWKHHFEFNRM